MSIPNNDDSSKLIILITGATSGLGRLAAKKCLNLGHTVIITARTEDKLKNAKEWILKDASLPMKDKLYGLLLDLQDLKTVQTVVDELHNFNLPAIDVVVHNAGCTCTTFTQVNGCIETTVFINAVAPLYLNRLLMPFLEKSQCPGKRILFVASSLHDSKVRGGGRGEEDRIPDNVTLADIAGDEQGWHSMKYYKISKLAVVWNMYALSERISSDIPVIAFCPGFVPGTELIRHSNFFMRFVLKYIISNFSFTTTEDDATNDYVHYITSDIQSASYYQKKQVSSPSADALDKTKQQAYWELANKTIDTLVKGI
ncbi:hypothetical protein BDF20DRAFT_914959 [Mycotypha africana]|uniref:uncharacterized protein n=1 Tax=Mycotypha africana TaxID=64632 RepID=UPI0023016C8B|nr:uncharacterized protein BDF20DRAFT_914959 [Mycotypha africana]KAI8973531.1 hypothetical protein BDF20DRAFT_914959 [Mycotypha africana]